MSHIALRVERFERFTLVSAREQRSGDGFSGAPGFFCDIALFVTAVNETTLTMETPPNNSASSS